MIRFNTEHINFTKEKQNTHARTYNHTHVSAEGTEREIR